MAPADGEPGAKRLEIGGNSTGSDHVYIVVPLGTSPMSLFCPFCGSADVVRSSRRWYERCVSCLGIYPFRCLDCRCRFLAWR